MSHKKKPNKPFKPTLFRGPVLCKFAQNRPRSIGRFNFNVSRQERSVTDIQDEVARTASCAVDALHGHPAGALDFSRKSLEVIEAALAEASHIIPRSQGINRVPWCNSSVATSLRWRGASSGGRYLWHNELQQPVLVVGEPQVHVAMVAWSKVQGRLAGDEADNISFFYSGFAERVTNAQARTRVLPRFCGHFH